MKCIALVCSAVTGTDGSSTQAGSGICTCSDPKQMWNVTQVYCQIDCSKYEYTTVIYTQTSCRCLTRYVWNTGLKVCELNCAAVSNWDGNPTTDNVTCGCQQNFAWSSTLMNCKRICSGDHIDTSLSDASTSLTACICVTNFLWSTTNFRCEVNCAVITNSNKTKVSYQECGCKVPFKWTQGTFSCDLDCLQVTNRNTNVPADSVPGGCACIYPYSWSGTTYKCVWNC